jgi:hypothetical protein
MGIMGLLPRVNWQGREDCHFSDFIGGMKNILKPASTLPYVFIMGCLSTGKVLLFLCDTNAGKCLSHPFADYISNVTEPSPY